MLIVENGAVLRIDGDALNTEAIEIDPLGNGGSRLIINGALNNDGRFAEITIGNDKITAASSLTVTALTNSALISLTSGTAHAALNVTEGLTLISGFQHTGLIELDRTGPGGSSLFRASFRLATAAPSIWTGGALLSGNALLEFQGGGSILTNKGGIDLSGTRCLVAADGKLGRYNALTGLTINDGISELSNGATLTTSAAWSTVAPSCSISGPLYLWLAAPSTAVISKPTADPS